VQTKSKDIGRKWMWGLLAAMVASQVYVVQELVAVFAFFALGFAAIAFVVAIPYVLQNCWKLAVVRLADMRQPVMNMASVNRENREAA
jgi:hypothetical protein